MHEFVSQKKRKRFELCGRSAYGWRCCWWWRCRAYTRRCPHLRVRHRRLPRRGRWDRVLVSPCCHLPARGAARAAPHNALPGPRGAAGTRDPDAVGREATRTGPGLTARLDPFSLSLVCPRARRFPPDAASRCPLACQDARLAQVCTAHAVSCMPHTPRARTHQRAF